MAVVVVGYRFRDSAPHNSVSAVDGGDLQRYGADARYTKVNLTAGCTTIIDQEMNRHSCKRERRYLVPPTHLLESFGTAQNDLDAVFLCGDRFRSPFLHSIIFRM